MCPKAEIEVGHFAPVCAKLLIMLLYGARFARRDLLRAICHLAKSLTKWSLELDKDLHHLFYYVKGSLDTYMVGYVGDEPKDIKPRCYADANLADKETSYSTSGVHLVMVGPRTNFPITGISKG